MRRKRGKNSHTDAFRTHYFLSSISRAASALSSGVLFFKTYQRIQIIAMTGRDPYLWPLPDPKSCVVDLSRPTLGTRDAEGSSHHKNLESCLDSGRGSSHYSGENRSEFPQERRGSQSDKNVNGASLHHSKEGHGSPISGPGKPTLCKEPKDHSPEDKIRGRNTVGTEGAGTLEGLGSTSLNCREHREHSATSTDPVSRGGRASRRGYNVYRAAERGQVSESQSRREGCLGLGSEGEGPGSDKQHYQEHGHENPRTQPPENLQSLYYRYLHYEWLRTSFANPLAYDPRYYSFKHSACQYYDLVQQFGFQYYLVWPSLCHPSQVPPPSPSQEASHYYQQPLPNLSHHLPEQLSPVSYLPNQISQYQTPRQNISKPARLEKNTKDVVGSRSELHQPPTARKYKTEGKNAGKKRREAARLTWLEKTEREITSILNTAPRPKPVATLFPPTATGIHARKRKQGEYVFRLPAQTDAAYWDQVRKNLVNLSFPISLQLSLSICRYFFLGGGSPGEKDFAKQSPLSPSDKNLDDW